MTAPGRASGVSDEELFGEAVCAWLDKFADAAPELDDRQAVLLAGLLRPGDPAQVAA